MQEKYIGKKNFTTMGNNSYKDIEVSFFKSFADNNPQKKNLFELLTTDSYKGRIEALRLEADEGKRKELKKHLPGFTPSAICEGGRALQNFVSHTGLLFFDFDYKDNKDTPNFEYLRELAKDFPCILYLGKSPSGNGFHALIPIADIDRDNHKAYYTAIYEQFVNCGLIPDKAASDLTRFCYVSYDPEAYINLNAIPLELDEAIEGQEQSLSGTLEPDPSITDLYGTYIEVAMLIERARIRKEERIKELAEKPPKEEPEKAEPTTTNPKDEKKAKPDIIDFADDYNEWRNIAANSFALSFGEEMGRPLFHAYSQLSDKYNHTKVDDDFSAACEYTKGKLSHGERNRLVTVGSFFRLCQDYGLMPTKLERDFGNLDLDQLTEDTGKELSADDDDL